MTKLNKAQKSLVEECKAEFAIASKSLLKKIIAQEQKELDKILADAKDMAIGYKISIRLAKKYLRRLDKGKKRGKNAK